MEAALPL
jgi:hypothetical protein